MFVVCSVQSPSQTCTQGMALRSETWQPSTWATQKLWCPQAEWALTSTAESGSYAPTW